MVWFDCYVMTYCMTFGKLPKLARIGKGQEFPENSIEKKIVQIHFVGWANAFTFGSSH